MTSTKPDGPTPTSRKINQHHQSRTAKVRKKHSLNQIANSLTAFERGDLFFQKLLDTWNQHTDDSESGPVSIDLQLCGFHLRLDFADRTLAAPLTRAFQHCSRPSPDSRPDLTIHALAGDTVRLLRESPWRRNDLEQPRGEIRSTLGPDLIASLVGTDIISIYHRRSQRAVYCIRADSPIPQHEPAAPFRPLLHWWLREKNWYLVHGAGLGDEENRGLLLIGKSGSGKSTLAVASSIGGKLEFCGDDYCAIRVTPPYQLAPVFACAKMTEETRLMLNLPLPRSGLFIERSRKHLYFPDDTFTLRIPEQLDLTALVLPSPATATHPEIEPLPPARTAIELSVSSLYQLPHAGRQEFNGLARLARTLPGWLLKVPDRKPAGALPLLKNILSESRIGQAGPKTGEP